jgi:hypothetical protein
MSMLAYKGYYEHGHIIPVGNPFIPESSEVIITILQPLTGETLQPGNVNPQLDAMRRFCEGNRNCDEPIPEFERASFREAEI